LELLAEQASNRKQRFILNKIGANWPHQPHSKRTPFAPFRDNANRLVQGLHSRQVIDLLIVVLALANWAIGSAHFNYRLSNVAGSQALQRIKGVPPSNTALG
jgi:hypothetical protein